MSIRNEFETSFFEYVDDLTLKQQLAGNNIQRPNKGDLFKVRPSTGEYLSKEINFAYIGYTLGGRDCAEAYSQKEDKEKT